MDTPLGLPTAHRPPPTAPSLAALVLCGGQSRRMGRAKEFLPLGDETMLGRVVRLVGTVAELVIVVAGPDQDLPALPSSVEIVRDRRPGRGPLEGIAAGLSAIEGRAEAAFVTACDAPLLKPELVGWLAGLLGNYDIVVPHVDARYHPLTAVYRTTVLPHVEALLAEDRLRPVFLFDRVHVRRVTAEQLTDVDPGLESLMNVNTPEEYAAATGRVKGGGCEW